MHHLLTTCNKGTKIVLQNVCIDFTQMFYPYNYTLYYVLGLKEMFLNSAENYWYIFSYSVLGYLEL